MKFWISIVAMSILLSGLNGCSSGGGDGSEVAPTITVEPSNHSVIATQSVTFAVMATGSAPLSYQWQNAATNADIPGATSASYTFTAALADNGSTYQVVVSNAAGSQTSTAAKLTVTSVPPPSNMTVLTYHNDNGRTGQNLSETILTPSNVNSAQFGIVGTMPVDGLVDAEPLYVGGLTINGVAHNVLFVATENDSVYAFDADTFVQLWQTSLLVSGESAPTAGTSGSNIGSCPQIVPEIGITSTPVIDITAGPHGEIFAVAMSRSGSTYFQRLHALDLVTGSDLMSIAVAASVPGAGTGSSNGTQTFSPLSYEDRAALLLLNGTIYTSWSSHCDSPPYTSWVISYNESNLTQKSVLNLTANGTTQGGVEGGIWMAGSGPAADSAGNIYLIVGNGTFDLTLNGSNFPNQGDYGNSFVKLLASGNSLSVTDYFTMHNACCTPNVSESNLDTDFGSGGAMVLPDLQDGQANIHHLAIGAGKDTNMYIVNRDNMGKFNPSNDSAIYQELSGALPGGVWSSPAYFNNTVYYGPVGNNLMAFSISNAKLVTPPVESTTPLGYRGSTPSVSANGATNGVVWALLIPKTGTTGTLLAYSATTLTQLYSGAYTTNQYNKFVTPMIANGKVYVGSPQAVVVFGLLN